jgi:hypothetical protein
MGAAAEHAEYMPLISAALRSPSAFREQRHNQQPGQVRRLAGSCPKRRVSGTRRLPSPNNLICRLSQRTPRKPAAVQAGIRAARQRCYQLWRVGRGLDGGRFGPLLAEEGRGPAGHLLGRDILDVLAHHPLLAERVAQPAAAFAVELIL